jgi:hypothetical protein
LRLLGQQKCTREDERFTVSSNPRLFDNAIATSLLDETEVAAAVDPAATV